jgi:two-component system, chemotaxis family, CheB/CheR fusion protein
MDGDMRRFETLLSRYENTVTVKKRIRDMVVLARQDLIIDAPFLHLDLISCRNLLTYLNPDMQAKLLSLFQYILNPKGLLFLGQSGSRYGQTHLFDPVDQRWRIYRRSETQARRLPALMRGRHAAQLAWRKDKCAPRDSVCALNVREFMTSLVDLFDCSGVLVDERGNITYVQGDVSPYFKFPEGSIGEYFNAVDIARPQMRPMLQSMLHRVAVGAGAITSNTIVLGDNGSERGVRIRIGPFPAKEAGCRRLIVFSPVALSNAAIASDASLEPGDPRRVAQLENALAETREQLQDTVEELETSTENLQTVNEELQTANEELQATNEELETSNGESQASNEELSTVNDELRAKSEETEKLLDDLKLSEKRNRLLVDELNQLVIKRTVALETTEEAVQEASEEQQLAEEKVRRLSKVFMDSSDPIIIEDLDTTILDASRAAEEAYGFTRAELIGQSIRKLIPQGQHVSAEELRRRCLAGETIRNWEGIRRDRTGGHQPVLVTAFALKGGHEKPESIATIAKDIAKIKDLQQEMERRANQLARLTNELTLAEQRERRRLARILHDHLQQLLAGAKLKLEMLRDEHVETGKSELQSALQMIMESLKASRSLSAELSPPVLYQHGLDKALDWLARWMHETHGLRVDLNLDPAAAPAKEELKILLFESVRELLFNVVKHAQTRSARVDMLCHDNLTRIVIVDTGEGFDPEGLWRGESDEETGFGLINIRERLQLIGGAFEIQSRPGKGTTVILTAPVEKSVCIESTYLDNCAKSAAGRPVRQRTAQQSARTRPGKTKVMLVDDHTVLRTGLSAMLSKFGDIEIAGQAANGEEAVALARETRPDVS